MNTTDKQYEKIVNGCKETFLSKNQEYRISWKHYRLIGIIDKLLIKVMRIISLQNGAENRVGDSIQSEFEAIVNYGAIAVSLFQKQNEQFDAEWNNARYIESYKNSLALTRTLMQKKNHDYGEAWRLMHVRSIADEIRTKLARAIQMEKLDLDENGKKNLESNFMDISNYAIFALILIEEGRDPMD